MTRLTISKAIEGFILEKEAQRFSSHTIEGYYYAFGKFLNFLGSEDVFLDDITTNHVKRFLAGLGKSDKSNGSGLSDKTLYTIHAYLSSLWTWAVTEGHVDEHIIRKVPAPDPEERAINPFTKRDIAALLEACGRTKPYTRPGKRECSNARPTALRDRTIILVLLDTGVRVSELCNLDVGDIDLKNRRITVFGKGDKERVLSISPATAKVLWRYNNNGERSNALPHEPFFVTVEGTRMTRRAVSRVLQRIGERGGVSDVHPHRFRHTFAIEFLRNGANIYALQAALGIPARPWFENIWR
jgi:integrase/recombinase XerD